jgi:hypothetical protein
LVCTRDHIRGAHLTCVGRIPCLGRRQVFLNCGRPRVGCDTRPARTCESPSMRLDPLGFPAVYATWAKLSICSYVARKPCRHCANAHRACPFSGTALFFSRANRPICDFAMAGKGPPQSFLFCGAGGGSWPKRRPPGRARPGPLTGTAVVMRTSDAADCGSAGELAGASAEIAGG